MAPTLERAPLACIAGLGCATSCSSAWQPSSAHAGCPRRRDPRAAQVPAARNPDFRRRHHDDLPGGHGHAAGCAAPRADRHHCRYPAGARGRRRAPWSRILRAADGTAAGDREPRVTRCMGGPHRAPAARRRRGPLLARAAGGPAPQVWHAVDRAAGAGGHHDAFACWLCGAIGFATTAFAVLTSMIPPAGASHALFYANVIGGRVLLVGAGVVCPGPTAARPRSGLLPIEVAGPRYHRTEANGPSAAALFSDSALRARMPRSPIAILRPFGPLSARSGRRRKFRASSPQVASDGRVACLSPGSGTTRWRSEHPRQPCEFLWSIRRAIDRWTAVRPLQHAGRDPAAHARVDRVPVTKVRIPTIVTRHSGGRDRRGAC